MVFQSAAWQAHLREWVVQCAASVLPPWASGVVWNGSMFGDSRKGVVTVDIGRPTLAVGVCLSTRRMEGEEHTVWAEAPSGRVAEYGRGPAVCRSPHFTAQLHLRGPVPLLQENQIGILHQNSGAFFFKCTAFFFLLIIALMLYCHCGAECTYINQCF